MMLTQVVAWPSATLSASSLEAGIFGRDLLLEPFGPLVERAKRPAERR